VAIPSGLKLGGVILADQVKNLDWRIRRAEFICKLPQETMSEVSGKLTTLL
jgi:mRNA interferase MazF